MSGSVYTCRFSFWSMCFQSRSKFPNPNNIQFKLFKVGATEAMRVFHFLVAPNINHMLESVSQILRFSISANVNTAMDLCMETLKTLIRTSIWTCCYLLKHVPSSRCSASRLIQEVIKAFMMNEPLVSCLSVRGKERREWEGVVQKARQIFNLFCLVLCWGGCRATKRCVDWFSGFCRRLVRRIMQWQVTTISSLLLIVKEL